MTDNKIPVSEKEMTVQRLSFISKEELWKLMSKGHIDMKEDPNLPCKISSDVEEKTHICELSPVFAEHISYPVGKIDVPQKAAESLPLFAIRARDFEIQASLLQQQQARLTAMQTSLEKVNLELTALTEKLLLLYYRNNSKVSALSFKKSLTSFIRPFLYCLKLLLKNSIVFLAACYFMRSSSSNWIMNCIRQAFLLLRRLTNSPTSSISILHLIFN
ncbi:Schizosaccharomyces specific protein [Schizosaccharomyces osmophilus]|uniref:Schizosaccharomyces specific protein n=1 Tax=Schizosaccharomyces osmophilus TaxID=2545709 RepID=A0AAF0AVP0_9SCHI|nr:Schizosaccharomyces specific protein [Schizosaccharomyces osmophilus]WBW72215.1 Schizosaccharomyces specific protein [Schizosaccharomyces osmophilus]